MLTLLIFIFFIVVYFYLPGTILILWAHKNQPQPNSYIWALILGISIFIVISFAFKFLRIPSEVYYLYGIFLIGYGVFKRLFYQQLYLTVKRIKRLRFTHFAGFILFALFTYYLAGVVPLTTFINGDLYFPAARDNLWRLSIMTEMKYRFPPEVPGFVGEILKNYHFFYDLLITDIHQITKINLLIVHTKLFTYFSAFLLVMSVYSLLRAFINSSLITFVGTLLVIGTGNLSYVLPYISSQYQFFSKPNIFMSDQPFDQSHNPFNLLAYSIFIASIYLFYLWLFRRDWKSFLLFGLCSGVLPGIKIYGGILILGATAFYFLYEFLLFKRKYYYTFIPFAIAIPFILQMQGKSFGIIAFRPGWLLTKLVQDLDRLNWQNIVQKEEYYYETGNKLRYIQLKLEQIGIYTIGNLNVRILGLLVLFRKVRERYIQKEFFIIQLILVISAFLIPLLFNQTRNAYDIIQFTPYGLLIMGIWMVIALDFIIGNFKLFLNRIYMIFVIVAVSIIAFPTNLPLLRHSLKESSYIISQQEVEGLLFLRESTNPNDIILTDMDQQKASHLYINFLSERRTFFNGEGLAKQIGINTESRKNDLVQFFEFSKPSGISDEIYAQPKLDFLWTYSIDYIYLSASGLQFEHHIAEKLKLPVVFKNQGVVIFKVT